jgi:hypothetical protein
VIFAAGNFADAICGTPATSAPADVAANVFRNERRWRLRWFEESRGMQSLMADISFANLGVSQTLTF